MAIVSYAVVKYAVSPAQGSAAVVRLTECDLCYVPVREEVLAAHQAAAHPDQPQGAPV